MVCGETYLESRDRTVALKKGTTPRPSRFAPQQSPPSPMQPLASEQYSEDPQASRLPLAPNPSRCRWRFRERTSNERPSREIKRRDKITHKMKPLEAAGEYEMTSVASPRASHGHRGGKTQNRRERRSTARERSTRHSRCLSEGQPERIAAINCFNKSTQNT